MNRNYFEIKRGSYGNGGSSQKLPPFPFICVTVKINPLLCRGREDL
jgi:hypothetical protein